MALKVLSCSRAQFGSRDREEFIGLAGHGHLLQGRRITAGRDSGNPDGGSQLAGQGLGPVIRLLASGAGPPLPIRFGSGDRRASA